MSSDRLYVNKSLHEISSHLIQLNTNLTQKIEGRNVKLAGEIQCIDTSFGTEMETLKTSHEEIRRSLQDHQARTENNEIRENRIMAFMEFKFEQMREESEGLKRKLKRQEERQVKV